MSGNYLARLIKRPVIESGNDGMRRPEPLKERRRAHLFPLLLSFFSVQSHQSDVVLASTHRQLEWQHPGRSRRRDVAALRLGSRYGPRRQSLLHQVSSNTTTMESEAHAD